MLNGTNAVLLQTILYLTANTNQPNESIWENATLDFESNSVYNNREEGKT